MEFSKKYHEAQFPENYASKHGESLARRLNDRREQRLLARALSMVKGAQGLESVADIGCGPGRFWPVLSSAAPADLFAMDVSHGMLKHALERHETIGRQFHLAAGSVTQLPFKDRSFDCVVAMRLLHHFGDEAVRRQALAELARVAGRHVIVSLWTDGNFKAWRRRKLEARRGRREYENRHVIPRDVLTADFDSVGLRIVEHYDLLPGYSQWRFYVLARDTYVGHGRSS